MYYLFTFSIIHIVVSTPFHNIILHVSFVFMIFYHLYFDMCSSLSNVLEITSIICFSGLRTASSSSLSMFILYVEPVVLSVVEKSPENI